MKIEFLISTVDRTDLVFLYNMFKNLDIDDINAVIINQCINIDVPDDIQVPHDNIKVFSVKDKGTSRSRNLAMEHMTGDICTFTDDDLIYESTVIQDVRRSFKNISFDVITFKTEYIGTDVGVKKYAENTYEHDFYSLLRTGDWEIFFRKNIVKNRNIKLDSRFGLGCEYPLCEYQIFLTDCYKNGLSLGYLPITVVKHPQDVIRTGLKFNSDIEKARGAAYARIFGVKAILMILYFSFKKFNLYKHRKSFFDEFKDLFIGFLKFYCKSTKR